MVRNNPKIKGYNSPNGKEKKTLNYRRCKFYLPNVTINKNKTEAIHLGKWPNINIKEVMGWEKDEIKI